MIFHYHYHLKNGLHAIAGENGIGKSTIFSCLSKFVYRGALQSYFRADGNTSSRITYKHNNLTNSWVKKPNWIRDDTKDSEITVDGFYEGSLIFGSRFTDAHSSKLGKSNFVESGDLIAANDFITKNLGKILRNNENHYSDLMKIKSQKRTKDLGFNGHPYFIRRNDKWVSQLFMSSGELLLIGLLHFINERIEIKKKRQITDQLSLILIDEIELALHPSAQKRLADFLNAIANISNFCIYFSTHSIQIINSLKPDNIFYINRGINDNIQTVNPCYPAYATRSLYSNDGYDLVILVEDELAKFIVERIIREEKISISRLVKILPCGGWEKTLELHHEMKSSLMLGSNCEIISILDGDIESEYHKKYDNNRNIQSLAKLFLPIHSVEKYLKKHLVDNPDMGFTKSLGDHFFQARSIDDIIQDYCSNFKNDASGKKLFGLIVECAEDQGYHNDRFKSDLCSFLSQTSEVATLAPRLCSIVS